METVDDATVVAKLSAATNLRDRIRAKIERQLSSLGLEERTDLATSKNGPYLRARIEAYTLKKGIRDRLRNRKFELARLERSHRRTTNGNYKCIFADNI